MKNSAEAPKTTAKLNPSQLITPSPGSQIIEDE
jgi:hypothetical protein